MEESRPLLSIVCPAFQEEDVLPLFHEGLIEAVAGLTTKYQIEILYVDDGSQDNTLGVLRSLAAQDSRVRYLSLSRNFGHQAALTAGLEHANGDAIVSLDSDLQHPPTLIPQLVERWREGYDIVLTERQDAPNNSWFKNHSSAGFYWLLRLLSHTPVTPTASDFRLLSRAATDALLQLKESHRFLRGMVNWLGFRVAKVSYQAAPRAAGQSRYTLRRMVRLASDGLVSFSCMPLRMPLFLGGVLLALGVLDLFVLLLSVLFAFRIGPWTMHLFGSVMVMLNGLVLTSLGVMGEYLGRVFEQVKQRPIYLVKESSDDSLSNKKPIRSLAA